MAEAGVSTGDTTITDTKAGLQAFQGRLKLDDATHISLQPYKGRYVGVRNRLVDIAAGFQLSTADNRITALGADAGAALAVTTLYYVYVSNSLASFAPEEIRCSLTAPSDVNGVKMLGAAGNALNWRFVGWVFTEDDGGGNANFIDSITRREVVNYYNRFALPMESTPFYVDGDDWGGYAYNNATFALIGGAASSLLFIGNGEDAIIAEACCHVSVPQNAGVIIGIGRNQSVTPHKTARTFNANAGVIQVGMSVVDLWLPAAGRDGLDFLAATPEGVGVVFYSDHPRFGGASDPRLTTIKAKIMG